MQFLARGICSILLDLRKRLRQLPAANPSPSSFMALVHVIAACTDRKRLPIPAQRRLRAIHGRTLDGRFASWRRALASGAPGDRCAADLYSGDHWSVVRALAKTAASQGWRVRLWAASAGYGLIPADATIVPYSATFVSGHPDSVTTADSSTWREDVRAWWRLQGAAPGPDLSAARRVADLAAEGPRAILIVASDAYISAMEEDLVAAREALPDPERLLVVSARPRRATDLVVNWIETDARLRQALGGAVGSLHARVARHLLTTLDPALFSASAARTVIHRLLAGTPALPVYDRATTTDDRVEAFIRRARRHDPSACHTPLLREFRRSGYRCEQSRFRAIFDAVTRET